MNAQTRVAVVTGGAQGIGRRTAELLAKRGYRLAIIDLQQPLETVRAIEANGHEAMGRTGDITDEAKVDRFVREVFERYGRADVLVKQCRRQSHFSRRAYSDWRLSPCDRGESCGAVSFGKVVWTKDARG